MRIRHSCKIPHRYTVSPKNISTLTRLLEMEMHTLNFLKPFALLFFTINLGILAYFFQFTPENKPLIIIFAFGMFLSLFFLLLFIIKFIRSISKNYNNYIEIISLREKGKLHLVSSIFICLLTFEIALVYWFIKDII